MEKKINIHIEKLPEGYYLATSDNLQGLVAQGRTIAETIEIARDIAKKLLEAQNIDKVNNNYSSFKDSFDYPLVIGLWVMGKLSGYKYREIVKRLKKFNFLFYRQAAGSHEIWCNEITDRFTTIPNHPGDMPEGTLRAILKQADINPNDFVNVK